MNPLFYLFLYEIKTLNDLLKVGYVLKNAQRHRQLSLRR
jgi:hypothetical protein